MYNARCSLDHYNVYFTGQMFALNLDHLIFVCSAKLSTLSEMLQKKVFIADLAVYDMTREFVLLNQLRHAEIDIRYCYSKTLAM